MNHCTHSISEIEGLHSLIHGGEKLPPELVLLRKLTRGIRQHRPATFRIFWGEVLDPNTRLRKIRDKSAIAITRADLKRMLLQAFIAGGSSK